MLFVVGGIPGDLFQRFQQLAARILGDGHLLISKPLRVRADGKFAPTVDYVDLLISDLAGRAEKDASILARGCGVILLCSPGIDIRAPLQRFQPFGLPAVVTLPVPTLTIGEAGRRTMNRMASEIRFAANRLRKGVKVMNAELSSRRNRTPILLPCRNFASQVFPREIEALFTSLSTSPDPGTRLRAACERIEGVHPFQKVGGASFYDDRGVRFKAPGRALHGRVAVVGEGHRPTCLLNGHLRLGGYCDSGFHYDCTKGEGGRLAGVFPNCHSNEQAYAGRPHLNIAPNDYIR